MCIRDRCAGSHVDIGSQWSTSTTYYFEILKVGNTIEVKRYTDDTYGTVADTTGQQTGTTSTGLQYFKVTNWNSGSGSGQTEGKIDNILIQSTSTSDPYIEDTSGANNDSENPQVSTPASGSGTKSFTASNSASTVADPSVGVEKAGNYISCLLYTSDAADE